MRYIIILFMFFVSLQPTTGQELPLGQVAPQLVVTDQSGQAFDVGAALSSGTAVVFFYPMASTPGCTKQACSLSEGYAQLQKRGVKVIGVSSDSAAAQQRFKSKYSLPYTLIADTDLRVNKAFGKKRFSRQAYIFHEGKLVWRDLKAATSKQFDEIVAALDELGIVPSK